MKYLEIFIFYKNSEFISNILYVYIYYKEEDKYQTLFFLNEGVFFKKHFCILMNSEYILKHSV